VNPGVELVLSCRDGKLAIDIRELIKAHWLLCPPEFGKIKKIIKYPKELSAFVKSITSTFAEKGNENWKGEEAKQYRILSALHYLYPEVIEKANPFTKKQVQRIMAIIRIFSTAYFLVV
jgi:hypothetical protein